MADEAPHAAQRLAATAGYRYQAPPDQQGDDTVDAAADQDLGGDNQSSLPAKPATRTREPLRNRFWAVTERTPIPRQPIAEADSRAALHPHQLQAGDWQPARFGASPAYQPIVSGARLLPALKRALATQRPGRLDVPRLTRLLAEGRPLHQLPRRKLRAWADRIVLVLDLSEAMLPYHADQLRLARDVARWTGAAQLQIRTLWDESAPLKGWRVGATGLNDWPDEACHAWAPLPAPTQVLLVSELGLLAKDEGHTSEAWVRWVNHIGAQGALLQVWCPVPLGLEPAPWSAAPWRQLAWDALANLPIVHWSGTTRLRAQRLRLAAVHRTAQRIATADTVRIGLAHAMRVEPQLLRAIRRTYGDACSDAGLEQLVWDHPDLGQAWSARAVREDALAAYAERFLTDTPPAVQVAVLDAIRVYYAKRNPLLVHASTLAWSAHASPALREQRSQVVNESMRVMHSMARAPWALAGITRLEIRTFMAWATRYADATTRAYCSPYMSQLVVAMHQELHGDAPMPQTLAGLATQDVEQALGRQDVDLGQKWLCMDCEHGWFILSSAVAPAHLLLSTDPVPLRAVSIANGTQTVRWEENSPPGRDIALARLPWGRKSRLGGDWWGWAHPFVPALIDGPIKLDTGLERITLEEVPRPRWATECGRDHTGLYATVPNPFGPDVRVNYPWPQGDEVRRLFRSDQPRGRRQARAAALQLELDAVGPLATLLLGDQARQSFRYLLPGSFLMGSPPEESDRFKDEGPQHRVTLTEGFWMADTACTQGLWLAVLGGENPSHFQGDPELPVERVSWDEVQQFLVKLQDLLPQGTQAVLPTEAQWEYACRADTTTAFSFGDTISPVQVNYDGNYPYRGAPQGEYREKTVPVKSLRANAWGLYQMHGNVWEWCADAMRDYTQAAVDNPSGATGQGADNHVVRGGSWYRDARSARSAQRIRYPRDYRGLHLGFRFALRSTGQGAEPQEAGGPVPEGRSPSAARDAPHASGAERPTKANWFGALVSRISKPKKK